MVNQDMQEPKISNEAFAIIKESSFSQQPLNETQQKIKTLIDEIFFWQSKFDYMVGENNGLRDLLGLPVRSTRMVVSNKKQSTNLRLVHKLQ